MTIAKNFSGILLTFVLILRLADEGGLKAALKEYDRTGKLPPRPSKEQIKETMLRHARLQLEFKGEYLGIREMRKHVAWYTKGMEGSAKLRDDINKVESYAELESLLNERIK